jgi:hypothetical protein
MRKLLLGGAITLVSVAGVATPAFAHDCFNPNKPAGAGVNYSVSFDPTTGEPIFTQVGPGKGNGGFATVDPSLPDVHTLGSGNNPHGVVGGPGSQKPEHACDGKGIDYLGACFGAG